MKIMKNFSSLALVSAHHQWMPTIDVIFERYERIFDKKTTFFYYYCVYVFTNTYFLYKQPALKQLWKSVSNFPRDKFYANVGYRSLPSADYRLLPLTNVKWEQCFNPHKHERVPGDPSTFFTRKIPESSDSIF